MLIGKLGGHSASWRTLDEAFHDEEWLVNLLYGAAILAYCRGNGAYAYRTSTELVDDGGENLIINLIQAILVDVERLERHLGNLVGNGSVALHLSEIPDSSEQRVAILEERSSASCFRSQCQRSRQFSRFKLIVFDGGVEPREDFQEVQTFFAGLKVLGSRMIHRQR